MVLGKKRKSNSMLCISGPGITCLSSAVYPEPCYKHITELSSASPQLPAGGMALKQVEGWSLQFRGSLCASLRMSVTATGNKVRSKTRLQLSLYVECKHNECDIKSLKKPLDFFTPFSNECSVADLPEACLGRRCWVGEQRLKKES